MRMGKPERIRRGQQAPTTIDADGRIPKHAARGSVVGKLSPDIISVYFSPELTSIATESLESYSDNLMQYDDAMKMYEEAMNGDRRQENQAEIDSDGTISTTIVPPKPIPPRTPLYKSEHYIKELEEVLSETKDYFQSKNGGWKAHVRAARFERVMDERYGRLRPLMKEYPEIEQFVKTVQRRYATGYLSPFRQGKPPIPKSTAVIILFMMQRGNLRWEVTVLAVLFFLVGLQPWALVVLIAGGQALMESRKRRPIQPMKKIIPSTSPYYAVDDGDEDEDETIRNDKEHEEKERQRKIDFLKQPVGTKLRNDEFKNSSLHQYDTIILGSGPSTLYTAALLSRTGRKVLVLTSKDDASGCYTLSGSDIPFDIESSDISRCSKIQAMLVPALSSSTDYQGGIRFAQIGTPADGHAFQILSVPGMGTESSQQDAIPFIVRADGARSLVEDAARSLGDGWPGVTLDDIGNSASAAYIQACNTLNATSNEYYMSKILDESVNNLRTSGVFQEATIRYASSFLDSGFPLNAHVRSLMAAIGMKGENIKPSKTSMGAHVSNICSATSGEGMHYPIGGPRAICHALRKVVEENDGRVLTHVPFNRLIFDESPDTSTTPTKTSVAEGTAETKAKKMPSAPRCIGIQLIDKREIRFDLSKFKDKGYQPAVVSMLGLTTTFIRLLPNVQRDKYSIPVGLPALSEQRPVIKILFRLEGSAKALNITGADFYRLPAAALAQDKVDQTTGEIKLGTIGWLDGEVTETDVEQINNPIQDSHSNPQGADSNSTDTGKKSNKVVYEPGKSWMQISFPSAKDPSFETRHGKVTTCVVTIEADDDFVTPFETKPKLFAIQRGKGETHGDYKWLVDRVRGDLLMNYPQIKGKITHSELVGPLYRGLSHTPQRYAAKGVRSDSPYPGLFSGGSDLTVGESLSASIVGGWLVANAVTGYGPLDHLFLQKNITTDILQYLEDPELSEDEEALAVEFSAGYDTFEGHHEKEKEDESNDPPELKKEI